MNAKHADPYKEQKCFCGKKGHLEVKWARAADHIFTRQTVCSWDHAHAWLKSEANRRGESNANN